MRHTISGIVEKPVDAQRLIDELTTRCLADRSDISLIAQDSAGLGAGAARAAGEVASAAGSAAATTVSSLFDFASAATRQVPGFGVLEAFGQLGARLSRAATPRPCARAASSSSSTRRPTTSRAARAK